MPNNVLVNTPNVKGDISSCGTSATVMNCASRPNVWICEDIGYVTNNCTGQTETLHSWSLTGFSSTGIAIGVVIIFLIGLKFLFD